MVMSSVVRRLAVLALGALLVGPGFIPASAGTTRLSLYDIPFSSGTVDPARDLPSADPVASDLVLVQFRRFGDTSRVHRVAATGAKMVQPLAPVSYLVWANAAQTRAIRALSGVRFAGVLPPAARIADSVTSATTELRVTFVGRAPARFDGSLTARAFTEVSGATIGLAGTLETARQLARLPRVYSIADAGGAPQLREERSDAIISTPRGEPLEPNYQAFLDEFGVDGSGVILSHVDSGADLNHLDLANRVEECIDYSEGAKYCEVNNHDDVIGHGTHTLGIVLSDGTTPFEDIDGFDYGLGVAPGAKAVVQNAIGLVTLDADDPFGDGYTPVYRQAYNLGAVVSQNSWGPSGSPKGYDDDTREFDAMVRDLDPATPGDQALGLVFSVMNGSGGTSTQGSPDEGKNLIGVGGTVDRPGSAFRLLFNVMFDETLGHIDDLCTCSAHGPALDGRLLPTLVAPGESVVSTRAAQGAVCGVALQDGSEVPPSPMHGGCTGTSMASPHVTGAYALFVQYYRDNIATAGATPSPALVKAALVNGATDLAGGLDADLFPMGPIPNNRQGWGRLNIRTTLEAWREGVVHVDQTEVFDSTGESRSFRIEPIDPAKPLKVTLAWTDALGHGQGGTLPAWVNDLDLVVSSDAGGSWLGNVFADGMSTTGGEADRKNNLENVFLVSPNGIYTVTVNAASIIGDGLPNSGDITDQDFALIIANAQVVTE
jgi:hypothetical protein